MNWMDGAPVLVGLDPSPGCEAALAHATFLASSAGAQLEVLHAIDPLDSHGRERRTGLSADSIRQAACDDARAALGRAEGAIREIGIARARVECVFAPPVPTLLRRAEELAADLLVLGWPLDSPEAERFRAVATKCLRRSETNVLIVRQAEATPFRSVAVSIDFDDPSCSVLAGAARLAGRYGSALRIVHVFDGPWHHLHYRAPTPDAAPEAQKERLAELDHRLRELANDVFSGATPAGTSFHVIDAPTERAGLAELARSNPTDLLILRRRARGLMSLLFGDSAERLLKELPGSILLLNAARLGKEAAPPPGGRPPATGTASLG